MRQTENSHKNSIYVIGRGKKEGIRVVDDGPENERTQNRQQVITEELGNQSKNVS